MACLLLGFDTIVLPVLQGSLDIYQVYRLPGSGQVQSITVDEIWQRIAGAKGTVFQPDLLFAQQLQ